MRYAPNDSPTSAFKSIIINSSLKDSKLRPSSRRLLNNMMIVEEQFTDNRNAWFEGDNGQYSAKVELERYLFEHKRSDGQSWLSCKDCGDCYTQAGFRVQCVLVKNQWGGQLRLWTGLGCGKHP